MSDPFLGEGGWIMERAVEDALAVLDAAGANRCAVLGLTTAACQGAILLAAGHPDRVSALVLPHPTPRPRWAPDFVWGMRPDEADGVQDIQTFLGLRPSRRRHAPSCMKGGSDSPETRTLRK